MGTDLCLTNIVGLLQGSKQAILYRQTVTVDVSYTITLNEPHSPMAHHAGQLKGLAFALVKASERAPEAFQQTVGLLEKFGASVRILDPHDAGQGSRSVNVSSTNNSNVKSDHNRLWEFTGHLLTGMVDAVVFRTGAGVTHFLETVSRQQDARRVTDLLQDSQVIAASRPAAIALAASSINPIAAYATDVEDSVAYSHRSAGSWRNVLVAIDQHFHPQQPTGNPMLNMTFGLEQCEDWFSLSSGLEARGASVLPIPVFATSLPKSNTAALRFFAALETQNNQVLLFNSPAEASSFAFLAKRFSQARLTNHLLDDHIVIAVGNDTHEILTDRCLPVDLTLANSSPLSSELVEEMAAAIPQLQSRKQNSYINMSGPSSSSNDSNAPWYNSPFMKACRGEPTDVTPIWMMRQAGRYMSEYREVRANVSFLDLCANPQLCSEVMCTAVEKLGVDAAIIFSDLLPILVPMGCDLEFVKGDGPVIHNPVRTTKDIDRIKPLDSNAELEFVMETVRQTRQDLPADMPLIGFAGAPFTLASYMIEGGSSRNYAATKQIMFSDPAAWDQLMQHLVTSISIYLKGQIEAGAQCVQLFDSWAGCLSFEDYSKRVHPYVQKIIASLPADVPVINFATGNPALLPLLADTRASVIGIDWRTRLDDAWQTVGYDRAVQGNLDPTVLLTNPDEIRRQAKFVLDQAAGRAGHIFNLGHGILPMTPVENAIALVDIVHELSSK